MYIVALCLSLQCLIADITPEALAIATCESGDTVTLGTFDAQAVNINVDGTIDSGVWQFNSYWVWSASDRWAIIPVANTQLGITSTYFLKQWPMAKDAPLDVQWLMFQHLWNDGRGAYHWNASKACWKGLLHE